MKYILLTLLILLPLNTNASLLKSFDFEDWGGSISSTPDYWSGSSYSSNCTVHENATEVVSGYDGLSAHGGTYFFIHANSDYQLSPTISGITSPTINAQTQIGLGSGSVCTTSSFDLPNSPDELYVEMWVAIGGWENTTSGLLFKLLAIYDNDGSGYPIFMLTDTTPNIEVYSGSRYTYRSIATTGITDGAWHKVAIRANYVTSKVDIWYDITTPTESNISLTNSADIVSITDGGGGTLDVVRSQGTQLDTSCVARISGSDHYDGDYSVVSKTDSTHFKISGTYTSDDSTGSIVTGGTFPSNPVVIKPVENWSAINPTGATWFAIDDMKIYDAIPTASPEGGSTLGGSSHFNNIGSGGSTISF